MVSSASSVSAALREPCRAKPPRPPAEPEGGAPLGAELLAVLGAADADDTVDDWDAKAQSDIWTESSEMLQTRSPQ